MIMRCEPALRADLQRYFGINFDDLEKGSISLYQVASCAAYLPPDGAVACEYNSGTIVWGKDTQIMADMANSLRWLCWSKTKDGQKGRNRPDIIKPPEPKSEQPLAMDKDLMDEFLKRKRY